MCTHMHRYAHTRGHMFTHIGTTHIDKNRENLFTFSGTENTFLLFGTNHVCQLAKLPMYHYPKITTALISDNADQVLISEMLRSSPCLQYRKYLTYLEQKIFYELWEYLQWLWSHSWLVIWKGRQEYLHKCTRKIMFFGARRAGSTLLTMSLSFSQRRAHKLCILGWLTITEAAHFHLLSGHHVFSQHSVLWLI